MKSFNCQIRDSLTIKEYLENLCMGNEFLTGGYDIFINKVKNSVSRIVPKTINELNKICDIFDKIDRDTIVIDAVNPCFADDNGRVYIEYLDIDFRIIDDDIDVSDSDEVYLVPRFIDSTITKELIGYHNTGVGDSCVVKLFYGFDLHIEKSGSRRKRDNNSNDNCISIGNYLN